MKTIVLDGSLMPSREAAHDYLSAKLNFPDYYGRNLDALYDLLSTYPHHVMLVVYRRQEMENSLGDYGLNILKTLCDAAQANPGLTVAYDGGEQSG